MLSRLISSGLLETLEEDDLFGIHTFRIAGRLVSRDLLDSIIEIGFLEDHLHVAAFNDLTILDIGAGYGRLAHRAVTALPNIADYLCTDALAVSTFISEYYLRFRKVEDKARAVPLDQIEAVLQRNDVDIAVNIHSFSECAVGAIEWWLRLLEKSRVKYLMIVPDALKNGGRLLQTVDGKDFRGVVEKHGYRLTAKEPKYRDSFVQEYGMNPTYHYLFERDPGKTVV